MGRFSAEVLVTTLLLGGLIWIPLWESKGRGEDFVQDYLSAKALLNGQDPYQDLITLREVNGFPPSHGQSVPYNPHPPIAIILTLPVAGLPFTTALGIVQLTQILALAVAWNWSGRLFSCAGWVYAAGGGALALWAPFWQGLDWGQPIGILALLTAAMWHSARSQRPVALGAILGIACLVRPFLIGVATTVSTWPFRRFLEMAGASFFTAGIGFAAVGSWPWTWLYKASLAGKFTSECGSLPGLLGMSSSTGTALFFMSLAVLALLFRRYRYTDGDIPIALTVTMLTYPLAWFQYDVILIPVAVWLAVQAHRDDNRLALWTAVLFMLIRSLPNLSADFKWQLWVQFAGRLVLLVGVLRIIFGAMAVNHKP